MNILDRIFIDPFESFFDKVLKFLPDLLTSLLLLLIGIFAGLILKKISMRIFAAVGLDRVSERSGVIEVMKRGGLGDSASAVLSMMIGWITIIIFAIISVRALEIPTIERLFERFLFYLPHVFAAALILIFGYLLSNFLGRAALIASVNAGIRISGLIGKLVKFTLFMFAATMALEQLGIGRETVIIAFAIVFGGIVFALALAFGLGGKDMAKNYMEKRLFKEEEKDDIEHL